MVCKSLHYTCKCNRILYNCLPLSKISGAFGPISMAIAPAPPVHLALPVAYTAMSPATTRAYRPESHNDKQTFIQQSTINYLATLKESVLTGISHPKSLVAVLDNTKSCVLFYSNHLISKRIVKRQHFGQTVYCNIQKAYREVCLAGL